MAMKICRTGLLFAFVLCASYPGECRSLSGHSVRPFGRTLLQQTDVNSLVKIIKSSKSTSVDANIAQLRSTARNKTMFDINVTKAKKAVATQQLATSNAKGFGAGLVESDSSAQKTAQQSGVSAAFNQSLAQSKAGQCTSTAGGQSQSGRSGGVTAADPQNGGGGGVSADDPQDDFFNGDGIGDDIGNFSPGRRLHCLGCEADAALCLARTTRSACNT
ncbi:hypothetical protein WJX73_003592 [Symbiochloris irregularis]|uniref:Secreted protein n=1 Tax=Symbiochloris irregularis TaxID=706552 RepID=A0AAW1P4C3_9CHLO